MGSKRYYYDTDLQFDATFTKAGVSADPDTVTAEYRINNCAPRGTTATKTATGKYRATINPDRPGRLAVKFKGAGTVNASIEFSVRLETGYFADQTGANNDYS